MKITTFWRPLSLTIALLVAAPIIAILLSLGAPSSGAWQHLQSTILPKYIVNTLLLMLQVAVLSTSMGVITAWLVAAYRFPGRRFFSWGLMLPMAAPAYITAYIYTDLLDFAGPVQTVFRQVTGLSAGEYPDLAIRSLGGAAIILSLVLYPYIYLLARNAFEARSNTLFDAARSLGASPIKAFWRVALPAARPAIVAGLALVLMETLADFGVVDYFGIPTFSTGIFRTWLAMGEKVAATKLAAFMFVFVLLLVALEKWSRKGQTASEYGRDAKPVSTQLTGAKAWAATLLCALPVLLGSLIPLVTLLILAVQTVDVGDNWIYAINTVRVSTVAALVTVLAALVLSLTQRFSPGPITGGVIQLSTLGYALPGALLAIGLLAPLTKLDLWLVGVLETHIGWQSGLLLTGTITVLVYAYMVRFLTVAYNTTHSGMAQISTVYDEVGRSLGAKPSRLMKELHIPLLRRSLLIAGLLVFVDCVRELPATLLLRPFNFETLATRVYRLASDERLAEASTASLMIILIGLIPVLLLIKLNKSSR